MSFPVSHGSLRSASLAALLSLLAASGHAALAAPIQDEAPATAIVAEAGGLHLRFERSAIEVRSASTSPEHVGVPWRYELQSYGRGSAAQQVAPALPRRSDALVSYERSGVLETYELREDGVKQSFLFAERPVGEGELVVRGLVRTALAPTFASDDGVRFERAGCAGIVLGAVLGIDADGRRSEGSIRLRGEVLEYTLPASFVDGASYPLLVDPLIGSSGVLVRAFFDDRSAAVVVRGDSAEWLACWKGSATSMANQLIYGQRFSSVGAPIGNRLVFVNTTEASAPAVARVAGRDTCLAAWRLADGSMQLRAVVGETLSNLIHGVVPISIPLENSPPALGGEALAAAGDRVALVWSQYDPSTSSTSILTRLVQLRPDLPNGSVTLEPIQVVEAMPANVSLRAADPAISRSGGAVGRWLITWTEGSGPTQTPQRLRGRFLLRNGTFDGPSFTLHSATSLAGEQRVDGDGSSFLVSFSDDLSLKALPVRRTPTGPLVGVPVTLESALFSALRVHSVAWMGSSVLIGVYGDVFLSPQVARLYSVDPFTGLTCESASTLEGATRSEGPAIGARFDGVNNSSREAFIVWSGESGVDYDLHYQRFGAASGAIDPLGGGCAAGGAAYASCSRSPLAAPHILRLHGAAPASIAYLVLSREVLGIACGGGCRLFADPFGGFALGLLTDARGDAAMSVPIGPGLVGQRFVFQWISPGASCFGGFDLSNALRVTIQ